MEEPAPPEVTFQVTIQGLDLTQDQIDDLMERLKCAVVLILPQRIKTERVWMQPKVSQD